MRIGIDARTLSDDFPGIGRYTHNLLLAMQPQLGGDTLVILYDPENTRTRYSLARLAVQPGVQTVPFSCEIRTLAQQFALPRLLRELGVDVFHAPYFLTAYLRLPCPLVLSLFDLIPLAYPPSMPSRRDRLGYWLAVQLALSAARAILVPSEATRADLARFFRSAVKRARVVPGAAAMGFAPASEEAIARVRERYRLPHRYILHVGTNKPHKNLQTLLEAYRNYHARTSPRERATLVLAGRHSPRYLDVRAWADEWSLGDAVRTLGQVPESDLAALYSGAACVVVPSCYEGFGLPVVEAMACGAPVLCSSAGSLAEVAGDGALVLAPYDVVAWSEAMALVAHDQGVQAFWRERGLRRATQFSWAAAAKATLEVYHSVSQSAFHLPAGPALPPDALATSV